MVKSSSPFAGKKLTGETSATEMSIGQRLFSSSPTRSEAANPQKPDETKQASNLATKQASNLATKQARKLGNKENAATESQGFDLSISPYKNDTFAFTTEELEALEDLKIELRRKMDIRTTKNDIVRCSIHTLIEDYRRHGAESLIVNRIRNKRPR